MSLQAEINTIKGQVHGPLFDFLMKLAVQADAANAAAAAVGNSVFVLDTTVAVPYGKNVYVTMASLMTAINAVRGPRTLQILSPSPFIWPAGNYVFAGGDVTLMGPPDNLGTYLIQSAGGATLRGISCLRNVGVQGKGGAALIKSPQGTGDNWELSLEGSASTQDNLADGSPAIEHDTAGTMLVRLFTASFLGNSLAPSVLVSAGSFALELYDSSFNQANAVQGVGAVFNAANSYSPAASVNDCAGFAGWTSSYGATDPRLAHVVSVDAGSWQAPTPANSRDAVSRMAVAVQGLLGGTIP